VSFDDDMKRYTTTEVSKTNQNTAVNLNPIVIKGDKVKKGQILTEGYATEKGELALGTKPDGGIYALERDITLRMPS
jgi:DNA-directed RNA polymerase subunit beta